MTDRHNGSSGAGGRASSILDNSKAPAPKAEQFLFTAFPNLQASKDRRAVVIDQMFMAPGWRTAQAIEDIARQLHPEVFK